MATGKIQTSEKRCWARKITRAKEGTLSDPEQVVGRGHSNAKSITGRELRSTDTSLNIMYWCRRLILQAQVETAVSYFTQCFAFGHSRTRSGHTRIPSQDIGGIKCNIRLPLKLRKAFFLMNYDG